MEPALAISSVTDVKQKENALASFSGVIWCLTPDRFGSFMGSSERVVLTIHELDRLTDNAAHIGISLLGTSAQVEAAKKRQLTIHGSPPCVNATSHLFFDPSFLNSSLTNLTTRSVVFLMVRLGTRRMENLPLTEQGMTVFDPTAAARGL